MMKLWILMSLLTLAACEGDSVPKSDSVNGVLEYIETPMEASDAARLRSICDALSAKEDQLSVLISSEYTFDYSFKGCSDSALGTPKTIATTIQRPYGNYVFERTDGDGFAFPDVETSTKGVLARFCNQGANIVSPIRSSDTGAMWVTTVTDAGRCSAGSGAFCVRIQSGSMTSPGYYQIHTNEWMKIKLTQPRRGFFIERTLVSSASCSSGKTVEKKVVLK